MSTKQKNEPRNLTDAELKRKAAFENLEDSLTEQGYRKHDLTIGVIQANLYALILALPLIIALVALFFILHPTGSFSFNFGDILIICIAFVILVITHEAIHGFFWGLFAKARWHAVSFGFMVQYLTPYCTCNEPLPKYAYMIGALAPTGILGLLPAVFGLVTGSGIWLAVGSLLILGGGGDLAIVVKLARFHPQTNDVLYLDHPYECGIVAFER